MERDDERYANNNNLSRESVDNAKEDIDRGWLEGLNNERQGFEADLERKRQTRCRLNLTSRWLEIDGD
jgi:hypothetical protein